MIAAEALRIAAAAQRAAYADGSLTVEEHFSELGQSDWNVLRGLPLTQGGAINEAGYFVKNNSAAFAAIRDGTLVISVRGSNEEGVVPPLGIIPDWLDAARDPESYANDLAEFVSLVLAQGGFDSIIITGHSLGAQAAAILTQTLLQPLIGNGITPAQVSVVLFGFPGIPQEIAAGFSGEMLSRVTSFWNGDDWVHYLPSTDIPAGEFGFLLDGIRIDVLDDGGGFDGPNWLSEHNQSLYYGTLTNLANFDFLETWSLVAGGSIQVLSTASRVVNGSTSDTFTYDRPGAITFGGYGHDVIVSNAAFSHSVFISGDGGDDTITGGNAGDYLSGGDGHDRLAGRFGADLLSGGLGDDGISGDEGDDSILGGEGNDNLEGGDGDDTLEGGTGGDRYSIGVNQGHDTIRDKGAADEADVLRIFGGATINQIDQISLISDGQDLLVQAGPAGNLAIDIRIENFYSSAGHIEKLQLFLGDDSVPFDSVDLPPAGPVVAPPTDDFSPSSPATNGVLPIGGTVLGTIETPLDKDWFAVSLIAGQAYRFDLIGVDGVGGTLADPFMRVRDSTGQSLEFNEDAGPNTRDSSITFVAPTTGTYFVSVGGDLVTPGTYTVKATQVGSSAGVTIVGDEFANGIYGTSGDDNLSGLGGNDFILGKAGNDYLDGGTGADSLSGGEGNDNLYGGAGADTVSGGGGNDNIVLAPGEGPDQIDGDAGFDSAYLDLSDIGTAQVFSAAAIASAAGHTFAGGTQVRNVELVTNLLTGSGDDRATYGADLVGAHGWNAGGGEDTLVVDISASAERLSVNPNNGFANGTITIGTGPGDGSVGYGNIEHLILSGGSADDQLFGTNGADTLAGNGSGDFLDGRDGADSLSGGEGNDNLYGGAGADTVSGGGGNDQLVGDDGADKVDAGNGDDTAQGGVGTDTILGGAGNDLLQGGSDNDSLSGADGADTIVGGSGDDVFAGGRGADVFVFAAGFGHDTIIDFRRVEDEIRFEGAGFTSFADMMAHALQVGSHVVITNAAGDSLQLNNVQLASLQSADFLFA